MKKKSNIKMISGNDAVDTSGYALLLFLLNFDIIIFLNNSEN